MEQMRAQAENVGARVEDEYVVGAVESPGRRAAHGARRSAPADRKLHMCCNAARTRRDPTTRKRRPPRGPPYLPRSANA
jgi:hypothetical protein